MRNPLNRRIPRELAKDWVKYAAIFILMVILVSLCSGMKVGTSSLAKTYYDSFDEYTLEDGHLTLDKALPDELRTALEEKGELKLYDYYYFDEEVSALGAAIRVYSLDSEVNKPCLLSGELPASADEIAIDRLFASNNNLSIGDSVTLNGKSLKITGLVALPNYSTLYQNNTDSMFDSIHFSIAVMTREGFDGVESRKLKYNYAWLYNESPADDYEAAERSEKFLDALEDELTDYDEAIAEAQVEELTDKLEKAGEEYGEIYQKSAEEKMTAVLADIETGAAEYAQILMTTGEKPDKTALSVDVDDYTFSLIESSVEAIMAGEEAQTPSEEELKEHYLSEVEKPKKSDLSVELSDFLFGIVEDAARAEIDGTEYTMPDDEEFESEIDKTDIIAAENYLPRYLNQAVTFSIEDIDGDQAGTIIMCYMMIALIAFIFAVTISNTIVQEAGVIGTLRASGYTRGELVRHYMVLPLIVTLVAAIVGNILGYTVMKDYCVNLYLGSYSLTKTTLVLNAEAFILSTVVPIVLMLIINVIVLTHKLKLSPLKFLRHDLRKNRNKKAMRLNTKIPFKTRFSLRIFITNIPGYIVMIIGIMFASVLIAFGDMFPRMLNDYQDIIERDMISEYQYVLYDCEEAAEVTDSGAEKAATASYDYTKEGFLTDSITVYGIVEGSTYVPASIPDGKALISTGISKKFGLKEGDTITLDEKYERDTSYSLEIAGIYDYESSLAIFMNIGDFNSTFGNAEDYFTGYFSNTELSELPEDDVATIITADDYTKLSTQLMVSMGSLMGLFSIFGALFFVIIVYVLCKQVIERNFQSIAMCKILGFKNGEIAALYIASTTIAVLIGLLAAIPFFDITIKSIISGYLYTMMTGYLPITISPVTYAVVFFTGLACYIVVAALQMLKVAKVSKSEALKNTE